MVTGISNTGPPYFDGSPGANYQSLKDFIQAFYASLEAGHVNQAFSVFNNLTQTLNTLLKEHPENQTLKAIQYEVNLLASLKQKLDDPNLTPSQKLTVELQMQQPAQSLETLSFLLPT